MNFRHEDYKVKYYKYASALGTKLNRILEIERLSFPEGHWNEEDFKRVIDYQDNYLLTVGSDDIYGFLILNSKPFLDIWNLAVHPEFRRRGLGSILINCLIENSRGRKIQAKVREKNLNAQKFFRAQKFRGSLLKGDETYDYPDEYEETYIFEWLPENYQQKNNLILPSTKNRIKQYFS